MHSRWLWAFIIMFILATGQVWAGTPTGVSGLINIPNTSTLPMDLMEASIHMQGGQAFISISVAVVQQVEVGAFTTNRYGPLNITVKGVVVPESEDMPGIAVGIDGAATYIVMSRRLQNARGYLGVGGRFGGMFGGISMELPQVEAAVGKPVTTLIMEHDGKSINFGARVAFANNVTVDAALINMEQIMVGVTLQTLF